MINNRKIPSAPKSELHPRNKHRERYNFKQLIETCKELKPFVLLNLHGDTSIDFANPEAVKMLNKALLQHFYHIENWNIPPNYLCPPIPGRADYIHYIADLLSNANNGKMPAGNKINCLDIGTGANCIYPIIGHQEYGWQFVGSDIDVVAIENAKQIIASNSSLKDKIELRLQPNPKNIFCGIISENDRFDVSICNPPFHASLAETQSGTLRKLKNLNQNKPQKATLNFGGKSNELWCDGGEVKFILNMITESKKFSEQCFWFSSLVSSQSNLKVIYKALKLAEVSEVKTIPMAQGNKISRFVAWTFLNKEKQQNWMNERWKQ